MNTSANPFVYPGIKIQTSATDGFPIEQLILEKWSGGGTGDMHPIGTLQFVGTRRRTSSSSVAAPSAPPPPAPPYAAREACAPAPRSNHPAGEAADGLLRELPTNSKPPPHPRPPPPPLARETAAGKRRPATPSSADGSRRMRTGSVTGASARERRGRDSSVVPPPPEPEPHRAAPLGDLDRAAGEHARRRRAAPGRPDRTERVAVAASGASAYPAGGASTSSTGRAPAGRRGRPATPFEPFAHHQRHRRRRGAPWPPPAYSDSARLAGPAQRRPSASLAGPDRTSLTSPSGRGCSSAAAVATG